MNIAPLPYKASLREAQNLFRSKEQARAFELAKSLHAEFPNAADIQVFHDAVARSILGTAKKMALTEDHDMVIFYARLLLDNPALKEGAHKAILDATRAGLDLQDRAILLYDICQEDPQNVPYWREIALCVQYLSANDKNIEIGFDTVKMLPGHGIALRGLVTLIEAWTATTKIDTKLAPNGLPQ